MYDLLRRENLLMLNLSSCKILESAKEAETNHYILIGLPLYYVLKKFLLQIIKERLAGDRFWEIRIQV